MKTLLRYSLNGLFVAVTFSSLAGCIRDNYDNYHGEGFVDIAMSYYWHDKGQTDRFENEVTNTDFYVFNHDGVFYSHSKGDNIHSNGYHQKLTLPSGDYTILAWANSGKSWLVEDLVPGVTRLEEARIRLLARSTSNEDSYVVENMPETLFEGSTQQEIIHVKNGKTVRDSIDLIKVTNDVHVRIRWIDRNGVYCTFIGHEEEVRPYIEAKNGEFSFFNALPLHERYLTYLPKLLPSVEETPIDYASVNADFRIGRLSVEGSTVRVSVAEVLPDGSQTRRYTRSLMELIRLTGHYDTQEQIDREDTYNVDIDFSCTDPDHVHANSWMVVGIRINGWVVKDINSQL